MYFGEYKVALDDKGRMRIPNKMKAQIGTEAVVICAGTDRSLFVMTESEFHEWVGKFSERVLMRDLEKQNAIRMISSTVFMPEEDAQGRFVLPQKLKEYAGINKKVVFLGLNQRVEIWAEESYEQKFGVDNWDINSAVNALWV
ncbi:MAG: hypothetical protein J6A99_03030 [Clostridia bacterium]|nr:hypothetical protein [Clostridia bacterium]